MFSPSLSLSSVPWAYSLPTPCRTPTFFFSLHHGCCCPHPSPCLSPCSIWSEVSQPTPTGQRVVPFLLWTEGNGVKKNEGMGGAVERGFSHDWRRGGEQPREMSWWRWKCRLTNTRSWLKRWRKRAINSYKKRIEGRWINDTRAGYGTSAEVHWFTGVVFSWFHSLIGDVSAMP